MSLHLALPDDGTIYRLGWTLIHTLWAGTAVAVLLAITMAVLRCRSARARYLAGCAAMVAFLASAVVAFVLTSPPAARPIAQAAVPVIPAAVTTDSETPPNLEAVPQSPLTLAPAKPAPVLVPVHVEPPAALPAVAQQEPPVLARVTQALDPALPWLVLVWMVGVCTLALWQFAGWVAAQRLKRMGICPTDAGLVALADRLARKLGVTRAARLLESALVHVPTVVGWLRPVILLPLGFATGLTPAQVESIIVHELSHIRRYDYLVNLLQSLVEALLFYHPATWYISRRIRIERENCCDDLVLAFGANEYTYAESLLHLARRSKTHRPAVGVAATGKPSELRSRIGRVLGAQEKTSRLARSWPVVIVLGAIIVASSSLMTLNAKSTDSSSSTTEPATQPAAGFELAVERTLTFSPGDFRNSAIAFETGQVISPNTDLNRTRDRMGANAWLDRAGLECVGIYRWQVDNAAFDAMTAKQLRRQVDTSKPGEQWFIAVHPQAGATYAFATVAQRRLGLMQIVRVAQQDGKDAVTLRYKLLKRGFGAEDLTATVTPIAAKDSSDTPTCRIQWDVPANVVCGVIWSDNGGYSFQNDYGCESGSMDMQVRFEQQDGKATLTRTFIYPPGRSGIDSVSTPMDDLPPGTMLVQTPLKEPARLTVNELSTLWQGDFVKDGKTIKTAKLVARLTPVDAEEKDKGLYPTPRAATTQPMTQPATADSISEFKAQVRLRLDDVKRRLGPNHRATQELERQLAELETFSQQRRSATQPATQLLPQLTSQPASRPIVEPSDKPGKVQVKGSVVDAETGQPIKSFKVIWGNSLEYGMSWNWFRFGAQSGVDGVLNLTIPNDLSGFKWCRIRIESEGYIPSVSAPFPNDSQRHLLDFKLIKGEPVRCTILRPDGKPASGMKVYIGQEDMGVRVSNGKIFGDDRFYIVATTDAQGRCEFGPQGDGFIVLAADETGYVQVASDDLVPGQPLTLQRWTKIRGVARIGDKQAAGANIRLLTSLSRSAAEVMWDVTAATNEHGEFSMDYVPAGQALFIIGIGRESRAVLSKLIEPGQTINVTLGGQGRTVTGKLLPVPGRTLKDGYLTTESVRVMPKPPIPADRQLKSGEDMAQWFDRWERTKEGKAWRQGQYEDQIKGPEYSFLIAPDGSFSIEDVLPGDYELAARVAIPESKYPGDIGLRCDVTVQAPTADKAPQDLGQLEVKPMSPLLTTQPTTTSAPATQPATGPAVRDASPPTTQPAAKVWRGKVEDAEGKPVAGATVLAREYSTKLQANEVVASATCDTAGEFSLTIPNGARPGETSGGIYGGFIAWKDGLAPDWHSPDLRTSEPEFLRFTLGKPATLSGVVVDESGGPIADAELSALVRLHGEYFSTNGLDTVKGMTTRTDREGKFEIRDLPADAEADLDIKAAGFPTVSTHGRGDDRQFAAGERDVRIVLPKAAMIEGVVVDAATGKGIPGQWVRASSRTDALRSRPTGAITGEDGHFAILDALPGDTRLFLAAPDAQPSQWLTTPAETKVVTQAGQVLKDVKIQAQQTCPVEIAVTDGNGKPVAEARVWISDTQQQRVGAMTDARGVAIIRALPGEYQSWKVGKEGYESYSIEKAFTVTKGQALRFEATLRESPALSGRVSDAAGDPVEGAAVRILPGGGRTWTRPDGTFDITMGSWLPDGPPAETMMLIQHKERNLAAAVLVEDGAKVRDVTLQPAVTLAGQVVDKEKRPVPGAQVQVLFQAKGYGATIATVRTDAEGRYEVKGLVGGRRYGIEASARGFASASSYVWLSDGQTGMVSPEKLTLRPANLTISGVVLDAQGKPVPKIQVQVQDKGYTRGLYRDTDRDGRFVIPGIGEGEIIVSARRQGGDKQDSGSIKTVAGSQDLTVKLGTEYFNEPTGMDAKSAEEANARTLQKLRSTKLSPKLEDISFADATQYIRDMAGVQLAVSYGAMQQAGINLGTRLSIDLKDVTAEEALETILRVAGGRPPMVFTIREGTIFVSAAKSDAASRPTTQVGTKPATTRPSSSPSSRMESMW